MAQNGEGVFIYDMDEKQLADFFKFTSEWSPESVEPNSTNKNTPYDSICVAGSCTHPIPKPRPDPTPPCGLGGPCPDPTPPCGLGGPCPDPTPPCGLGGPCPDPTPPGPLPCSCDPTLSGPCPCPDPRPCELGWPCIDPIETPVFITPILPSR